MELTQEQLKQVEEFAAYFFSTEEIAVIMELNQTWCRLMMLKDKSDFKDAYTRGQLRSEAEFRKSVFEMAKKGSAPAQILADKIMEKSRLRNIDV